MSNMTPESEAAAHIVVVGGGIAGLEAMLALRDLAGDRVRTTLVSRQPEFVYRPMLVDEPFSLAPAERHELAPLAAELGAEYIPADLDSVDPEAHLARLSNGDEINYDALVVCVGARMRPAFKNSTTLRSWSEPVAIDDALKASADHPSRRIAFVVPPGSTWTLPLYELAMLSQNRAAAMELELTTTIITTEGAPLAIFGPAASTAVTGLLEARGIEWRGNTWVGEEGGDWVLHPAKAPLDVGSVVALPLLSGPRVEGLPADADGYLPIDEFGEVIGAPDVFAAGDGTSFPIKQGGLGTQQADAAAELIASRTGAHVDPQPFRPVLRGKLITGSESLNLASTPTGGAGPGQASLDYLWWPPQKVAGRYLAPFLEGTTASFDGDPPALAIDIEVSLPHEWHSDPQGVGE